jgi:hypothetical protein
MVGDAESEGHCRKACGKCTVCEAHDKACITSNRLAQGFLPDLDTELQQLFPDSVIQSP